MLEFSNIRVFLNLNILACNDFGDGFAVGGDGLHLKFYAACAALLLPQRGVEAAWQFLARLIDLGSSSEVRFRGGFPLTVDKVFHAQARPQRGGINAGFWQSGGLTRRQGGRHLRQTQLSANLLLVRRVEVFDAFAIVRGGNDEGIGIDEVHQIVHRHVRIDRHDVPHCGSKLCCGRRGKSTSLIYPIFISVMIWISSYYF